MPVYQFNLIWSPATRLVNRVRFDKGGPVGLLGAFSYTIGLLVSSTSRHCYESMYKKKKG